MRVVPVSSAGRANLSMRVWRTSSRRQVHPAGFIELCIPTASKVSSGWPAEGAQAYPYFTRRGYDWAHKLSRYWQSHAKLRVKSAMIDGEGVSLRICATERNGSQLR